MSKKIYVTRYALTTGIQEFSEIEKETIHPTMVIVKDARGATQYFHGKDWHRDRASAVWEAEQMRVRKIASLKKKIDFLEKLKLA